MMVLSLWAMVSTVRSANSRRIVSWMRSSVSMSTAAVASSRTRILLLRSSARAKHTNCRWPTLWKRENVFIKRRRGNVAFSKTKTILRITVLKQILNNFEPPLFEIDYDIAVNHPLFHRIGNGLVLVFFVVFIFLSIAFCVDFSHTVIS